jgi:hypothetical protein
VGELSRNGTGLARVFGEEVSSGNFLDAATRQMEEIFQACNLPGD